VLLYFPSRAASEHAASINVIAAAKVVFRDREAMFGSRMEYPLWQVSLAAGGGLARAFGSACLSKITTFDGRAGHAPASFNQVENG